MEKIRVNLGKVAPDLYQGVSGLEKQAKELSAAAGLAEGFTHLLRLRASQINQCAYCVRMHTRDAMKSGETSDRISLLAAWRESGYFTEKERAALALTEAVTRINKGQVPDELYAEVSAVLSEQEIAAVEWIAIVINAWNRIAIASRYPVKP
jgi:AhpD family alkylhydroperoxidase